jgi:hypothetical protein
MGEAKRRQQLDPTFARSPQYVLVLHNPRHVLAEIPFTVKRQATGYKSDQRALANAVVIFSFLQEPELEENRENLRRCMSDEAIEALSSLLPDLESRFWARVLNGEGETLGDFSTHNDLIEDVVGQIWAKDVMRKAA